MLDFTEKTTQSVGVYLSARTRNSCWSLLALALAASSGHAVADQRARAAIGARGVTRVGAFDFARRVA